MRTVDDLRAALVEETSGLESDIRLGPIVARARRRRWRQAGAAAMAGLIVAASAALASLHVSPTKPEPLTSPTVAVRVDPSFPPYGQVITTGARVGADQELVAWFGNGPDTVTIASGLLNRRTGQVRDLETISGFYSSKARTGGFQMLAQVDDRAGGVLDYGLFIGTPGRIVAQVRGVNYEAHLSRWSVNPAFVVFWTDYPGTPMSTDSNHPAVDPDAIRFIAYDPGGKQVAASDGLSPRRGDAGIILEDRPKLGDLIPTGSRLADGGELVFWFVGADDTALLKAGSRSRAGTVTELKELGVYHMPPFNIGFYRGWDDFDGPAGTHIMVDTYVGPATRIVTGAPGPAVHSGFAHWSSYPELIISWADNISTADYPQTAAVAYDAAGKVVGVLPFPVR